MGNSLASCRDPDVNSNQQPGHNFLTHAKFKGLKKIFVESLTSPASQQTHKEGKTFASYGSYFPKCFTTPTWTLHWLEFTKPSSFIIAT